MPGPSQESLKSHPVQVPEAELSDAETAEWELVAAQARAAEAVMNYKAALAAARIGPAACRNNRFVEHPNGQRGYVCMCDGEHHLPEHFGKCPICCFYPPDRHCYGCDKLKIMQDGSRKFLTWAAAQMGFEVVLQPDPQWTYKYPEWLVHF